MYGACVCVRICTNMCNVCIVYIYIYIYIFIYIYIYYNIIIILLYTLLMHWVDQVCILHIYGHACKGTINDALSELKI